MGSKSSNSAKSDVLSGYAIDYGADQDAASPASQAAPDDPLKGYSIEAPADAQPQAAAPSPGAAAIAIDVAKQAAAGPVRGAVGYFAAPMAFGQWLGSKAARGLDYVTGVSPQTSGDTANAVAAINDADPLNPMNAARWIYSRLPTPQTNAGRYTDTVGQFAANALAGGPSQLGLKLAAATTGGLASEKAGQMAQDYGPGAEMVARIIGGVAGGAAVPAAIGLGRAVQNARLPAIPDAAAVNKLNDMLNAAGYDAASADARLAQLGPEARPADLIPESAAGTAQQTPEAMAIAKAENSTRMSGAQGRMDSALTNAYGAPMKDPAAVESSIRNAQGRIRPEYQTAIQNAPQLPPTLANTLAQQLTSRAADMTVSRRGAMMGIMNELDDALHAGTPSQTAARLLDLRQSLDDRIVYDPHAYGSLSSADKAAQGVLKEARGVVDDVLKNRIPGIAAADAKYADQAAQLRAFNLGRGSLKGGPNAMTPAEQADAMRGMTNAQQRAMYRHGTRSEIGRMLMNNRNTQGDQADRILGRDWNDQKILAQIGPQKYAELKSAIEADQAFNATNRLVNPQAGSRTAVLDAARRWWGPGAKGESYAEILPAALATGMVGGPAAGATAAAGLATTITRNKLASYFNRIDPNLVNAVARLQWAKGAERAALLKNIATMQARLAARAARPSLAPGYVVPVMGALNKLANPINQRGQQ